MAESSDPISFKALRDYCRQLGITASTAGQAIDDLIAQARKTDDPRAWLAALANAPPEDEGDAAIATLEIAAVAIEPAPPAAASPAASSSSPPVPSPSPAAAGIDLISIALPVSREQPVGYLEREMHLELKLDLAASQAFRRVWKALDESNARLANGRHVSKSRADAIRWVFEQIAAGIAAQEPPQT